MSQEESKAYFEVSSIKNLSDFKVGDKLDTSDYCIVDTDKQRMIQFAFKADKKESRVALTPGIWSIVIKDYDLKLEETKFTGDTILDTIFSVKTYSDKIDRFFSRLNVYYKHGIKVPKRGVLFWGPAGSGKSTIISKVCTKYVEEGKTAVILWQTDKIRPGDVKNLMKKLDYQGVNRLILVAEDIGGTEASGMPMRSDASLLALLDNQEQAFTVPTLIIATTNYPENFMANLTNRPNRFDDKFEIGHPSAEARIALYKFYAKDSYNEEAADTIAKSRFNEFTPAHIREVILRSELYDDSHMTVLNQMAEEIDLFKKAFEKKSGMGIL